MVVFSGQLATKVKEHVRFAFLSWVDYRIPVEGKKAVNALQFFTNGQPNIR
ncbi:hypothetical protein OROHE_012449 [Orobanche hederae]